jgi:ribonucleoside-diphosphate reductase beta chain
MANFILEGIYFYSGFMFFYNLERNGKMPGSAQEIRYINRDENTHLWLFRNIIRELQREESEVFTEELKNELREMMRVGVEHEINWGIYVIGDKIQGININLIESYIKYLGNKRLKEIGLSPIFEGYNENPANWVDILSDANSVKTDFFEAKSTAYAKVSALIDDL